MRRAIEQAFRLSVHADLSKAAYEGSRILGTHVRNALVLTVDDRDSPLIVPGQPFVVMRYAVCDRCGDYSYRARQLGEEWICIACMKKADIDDLWVYDYQQALDELDREFSSAWEEVEG